MKAFELHVVVPSYSPSNATTNRIMAFLRGFSEHGVTTHVTYLVGDGNNSKVREKQNGIYFTYMWEGFPVKNRILRQIQFEYNSRKYVRLLPKNACVFLPWPSSRLLNLLVRRKDLKVFYEETELPELYTMRTFNLKSYFKSIERLTGLFVISTSLEKYYVSKGIPKEKIQIINMIVDINRFNGIQQDTTLKEKYIAYCGTASNNKDGVDKLINAFSCVEKKYPEYKLYIIGAIPSKTEEFYNYELVKKLGIERKVVFTGVVSACDMPYLLKNATILALARPNNIQSRYGFPTKLGEYLATGNAVVVTSVGDIPLFLKDRESALIADPSNDYDFANKLCWAIEHPSESIQIGENGRRIAEKFFSYQIEGRKIINSIFKVK